MIRIQYFTITAILLLTSYSLESQDRFQRIYQTDQESFISTSLTNLGGGYLVLSLQEDEEGLFPKLNLTSLDNKGSVNWSNNYEYMDSVFLKEIGEVVTTVDGGIAFSVILVKDGLNKVVTKVDPNGNVVWSLLTGKETDSNTLFVGRSNLVDGMNGALVHCNAIGSDVEVSDIIVSSILYSGELNWSKSFSARDSNGMNLTEFVRDSKVLEDSTILLVGNTSSEANQIFLTKLDSTGRIIWSNSYTGDFSSGLDQSALSITEMVDNTIVVLGAHAGNTTTGFVLHLSSRGDYLQSKTIRSLDTGFEYFPNNVQGLIDTSIIISFKRLNLSSGEIEGLIVKYDLDSTLFYQSLLRPSIDKFVDRSGLVSKDSMTVAFLTSMDTSDRIIPYLSKIDESGDSFCGENVDAIRFDSSFFNVDTLSWVVEDLLSMDTISVVAQVYGGFSPPTLTLPDTVFCPQDPVFFIVNATVEGGKAYLWDDNNTDSIRLFTEEGMHSVTVTVGKDICFELCDTTNISVKELPMAAIVQNTVNFCSSGVILLAVTANNTIVDIEWSTGEKTPIIAVSDLKEYSVQIIDDCGNTANASLDLSDFSRSNIPIIVSSDENLCVDNTIVLTVSNIEADLLTWSTGESGVSSISVSESGTYSVQNNEEFCPGEGTITISEAQFVEDLTVEINENCSDPIQLLISGTGIVRWEWSDGTSAAFLNVTAAGIYSVTAFDICDQSAMASIEITPERVLECIPPPVGVACLEWPNAFIPSSREDMNTTFGPKNNCFNIESYELRIFNRWGKNIYTTTNVLTRWDGRIGGEIAPPDVYFYWASYSDGTTSFQDEGDITLIR